MAKTVKVRGNGNDGRVVLWEKNEAHPNGEVFVVNDGKDYEVAKTPAILRLLDEKRLVEGKREEDAPPLRPATDSEEDAAGLTTQVEKTTARVPVREKKG